MWLNLCLSISIPSVFVIYPVNFLLLFCFGAKVGGRIITLISIKNLKLWYEDLGKYFKYLFEEFCLLILIVQL